MCSWIIPLKAQNMEIEKQIIELVSGNLNTTEKHDLLERIKKDDQLRKEYDRIKNAWSLSSYDQKLDSLIVEKSFVRFRKQIGQSRKIGLPEILKYAAILIVFFALGIVTREYIPISIRVNTENATQLNEINVPNGERANLTLADGTKVWLNSGTTMSFPNSFNSNKREVKISGEAFFDVVKSKTPFIVSSSFGKIHVLGTTFNVRAYENMLFQTTLVEGEIQFKNSTDNVLMKPGHQLKILLDGKIAVDSISTRNVFSWKDGVISFDMDPLEDVFKKLERHYDVQIIADKSISSIRFTGEIRDETIEDFLNLINRTKPIKYEYDKKKRILNITKRL